jgi:glycosyltransferase involved in cell wall biosynthesis
LRLLFVSHYNYYRNFETLFRTLPLIKSQLPNRTLKLLLTCRLRTEENPGRYGADAAARLVRELGVETDIVELGTVPYDQLHHVYKRCDVYVTAAYAESFAHPLVEAMASGCPVIASDLAVHQEVCGDAARYFPRFSAQEFADRIAEFSADQKIASQMKSKGLQRARDFSWARHVSELVALSGSIA